MFHVKQKYKRDILVFKSKDYIKNNEEFSIYKDSSSGILWTDVPDYPSYKSYYETSVHKIPEEESLYIENSSLFLI